MNKDQLLYQSHKWSSSKYTVSRLRVFITGLWMFKLGFFFVIATKYFLVNNNDRKVDSILKQVKDTTIYVAKIIMSLWMRDCNAYDKMRKRMI